MGIAFPLYERIGFLQHCLRSRKRSSTLYAQVLYILKANAFSVTYIFIVDRSSNRVSGP